MMPLPQVPPDSEVLTTWINRHQNRYKYRDQGIDRNLVRNNKAYCYATISYVDFQIGRILATLEESGQLDNTLIIFASEHGELLGDYNCFGKRSMHDASSRVPMLVRGPGFAADTRCKMPVSLVDLLPTAAAAAGVWSSSNCVPCNARFAWPKMAIRILLLLKAQRFDVG
jgi:arylsulfatase A-like enzyme